MARKLCNICNTRPVDAAAGISDACFPCYEEGGWENQHQDDNHTLLQGILAKLDETGAVELRKVASKAGVKNAGQHKSAELREIIREAIVKICTGCWICHPELNEAQKVTKTRAPQTGERKSRKGQKINVPLQAPGELKAAVVVKAAGDKAPVTVDSELGGTVRLDITTPTFVLILAWDQHGRYDYDRAIATVGGKARKVRNVAEALRLLAEVL